MANGKVPVANGTAAGSSESSTPRKSQPVAISAVSPHSGDWSEQQQLGLVAAMKKYSKVPLFGL